MTYEFEIYGNQEDIDGNPIPYTRTPYQSRWRKDAIRYYKWKDYVVDTFKGRFPGVSLPLIDEGRTTVKISIVWKNERHGDCDNVWKGIVDALFKNDKHVIGSFDFEHSKDKVGRVEIQIKIQEKS